MALELSYPEDPCWAMAAGLREASAGTVEGGDPAVVQGTVD